MSEAGIAHLIRLAAVVEVPDAFGGPVLQAQGAVPDDLGSCVARDLAAVVPAVTSAHLVVGPALLAPAQLLSPEARSPWPVLQQLAPSSPPPGMTLLARRDGRWPHPQLAPERPLDGRLLCLPMLLVDASGSDALARQLEDELFERGALSSRTLAALAGDGEAPVHGQLMTWLDLVALIRVQLAAAGLESHWPVLEQALFRPGATARFELPGELTAHWDGKAGQVAIDLGADAWPPQGPRSRLRFWQSFRQLIVLLDEHGIDWRVDAHEVEIDAAQRWAIFDAGPARASVGPRAIEDHALGVLGYEVVHGERCVAIVPLRARVLTELLDHLRQGRVPA